MVLRGTSLAISLTVLALVSATLSLFNITEEVAPETGLAVWPTSIETWPQLTILFISCISSIVSISILARYAREHSQRMMQPIGEYTLVTMVTYIVSGVIWGVGAGLLSVTKASGDGNDIWDWSCQNTQTVPFLQELIPYSNICSLRVCTLLVITD